MLLPPRIFELSRCATEDISRRQIACVRLERNDSGPKAIATTGKVLAIVKWDEPDWREYPDIGTSPAPTEGFAANVPLRQAKELARTKLRSYSKPILEYLALEEKSAHFSVSSTDLDSVSTVQVREEMAGYPEYSSVLPDKGDETASVLVNVGALKTLCETTIKVKGLTKKDLEGKGEEPIVRLVIHGENQPIALESRKKPQEDTEITTYIMPYITNK